MKMKCIYTFKRPNRNRIICQQFVILYARTCYVMNHFLFISSETDFPKIKRLETVRGK